MTWRRGTRDAGDRGAIVMLLAILAGTGALAALVAIGVDMGRFYFAREQVARAVRSDAAALGQQCYNHATGTGPLCASVQTLYAAAAAAAAQAGGLQTLDAVCLDTSTVPATVSASDPVTCAQPAAGGGVTVTTTPGGPASVTAKCINKVRPYVRVVLHATQAVHGFMPVLGDKVYSDCGQATWVSGYLGTTVSPFVAPAWQWNSTNTPVLLAEATSEGGGQGSRNIPNGGKTATWGNAYSPTSTFYSAPSQDLLGLNTSVLGVPADCGATVQLLLNSVQVTGQRISSTCTNDQLDSVLSDWLDSERGKSLALSGNFTDPNNSSCLQVGDCWNIQIVAFGNFRLSGYHLPKSEGDSSGGWTGSHPGEHAQAKCQNKAFCLYGTWDPTSLKFAGNNTAPSGITVLQ